MPLLMLMMKQVFKTSGTTGSVPNISFPKTISGRDPLKKMF